MEMDGLASAFAGLPYFSPGMMVNRSETCATRKLTQCTDFGVSMNDISSKFARGPANAPDLSPADFMARKSVVDQVADWCDANAGKPGKVYRNEWAPILYNFEIVKSAAKRERDWGHLVFTDMTISRFLLVMTFPETCNCGNYSHHDYDAITKYHADRFMSLLTYLHGEWDWGNKPSVVRATYVTPKERFKVSKEFLEDIDAAAGDHRVPGKPPIFQVTADKFIPTLLESELEKIDNTVARGSTSKKRTGKGVRDQVLGTKEDRPEVSKAFKQTNMRQCAYCEEPKELKNLSLCSRCKLVYYCGKDCQRMAWPSHKFSCRKASESN
ncbi:hypothetical protein K466DRAFT_592048 [Polyporus arcularius HHB13444]|uniref:MYND-type domain-containing protein n=1 Tax=Polyporus arcularius HHB13444 TaxID=1314778 RepID=A0A5C3P2V7_9APHY|nr:hypothetical protein K466DRAFT_592048 [Polyporus arcularius HHB13444]